MSLSLSLALSLSRLLAYSLGPSALARQPLGRNFGIKNGMSLLIVAKLSGRHVGTAVQVQGNPIVGLAAARQCLKDVSCLRV